MSPKSRIMRCESGAVTIEWVIMSAAVLLLGFVAVDPLVGGVSALMEQTGDLVEASGARLDEVSLQPEEEPGEEEPVVE